MKTYMPFLCLMLGLVACTHKGGTATESADVGVVSAADMADAVPAATVLTGDPVLNRAARFYAGVSCEGIALNTLQQGMWQAYEQQLARAVAASSKTTVPMDSLMARDMADLRERCDYVFYPFSGPDFIYPITMFPEADCYFLAGLEPSGPPLTEVVPDAEHYRLYTGALDVYMRNSFFRTKSMDKDLGNEVIGGTVPVLSMLMALKGYEIVGVSYKTWTADGTMTDAEEGSPLAEIRFFHPTTPTHLQTLYYLSGDLSDDHFDARFGLYLDRTLSEHQTVTFFKAASYLLHSSRFFELSERVCMWSKAIVGDDSGIPYRYVKDDYNVTLYGRYQRPIKLFGEHDYQLDLQQLYDSVDVRPLPFRIGYNRESNWMVARRKS